MTFSHGEGWQAAFTNQANKWMTRAEAACIEMVRDTIMPELSQQVADALSLGLQVLRRIVD